MMRPLPAFISGRAAALTKFQVPLRFTLMTLSKSSSLILISS